jgi:hypothetical protein
VHIRIDGDSTHERACTACIAVPEKALTEAGHIRTVTADCSSQRKHELDSLAQMALMQFEDSELVPTTVGGRIQVTTGSEILELDKGLLISRLLTGEIVLLINSGQPARKFLVAAHRFCTRRIRLDL